MNLRGSAASAGSAMLHAGILFVLMAASYLHVEALSDPASRPPGRLSFVLPSHPTAPAPSSGRPAPGAGRMMKTGPVAEPVHETAPPRQAPADEPTVPQESPEGIEGDLPAETEGAGEVGDAGTGGPTGTMGDGSGGEGTGTDGGPGGDAPDGDTPIYLTGEVRPPRRITFVKPEYPEVARRARVEGKVILEIVVGRSGDVESVMVLRSAPLFDQAAIEAVARWRYQPALQSGRPVRVYLTVIVEFGLE